MAGSWRLVLSHSNDLVRQWSTQLGPAVAAGSLVHPVRVPIVTFLAEHGQEISAIPHFYPGKR